MRGTSGDGGAEGSAVGNGMCDGIGKMGLELCWMESSMGRINTWMCLRRVISEYWIIGRKVF